MIDYNLLNKQTNLLIKDVSNNISILANVSALLYHELNDVSWVGFYLLNKDVLELGPFQGKVACVSIPLNKGVCGTSAAQNSTILVPNVHEFIGHIACDSASNSEIVIPVHKNGELYGVLDIDSTTVGRFTNEDKIGLEQIAITIGDNLK